MGKKKKKKNKVEAGGQNHQQVHHEQKKIETKKEEVKMKVEDKKTKPSKPENEPEVVEKSNRLFWRKFRWPMIGMGVFLVICSLVVGGYFGFRYLMEGKSLPGSYIAGIDVSRMTPEEIKKELQEEVMGFSRKPVVVSLGKRKESFDFAELGVFVNFDETVNQVAFMGDEIADGDVLRSFVYRNDNDLVLNLQHERALASLEEVFGLEDLRARNASIALGDDKNIVIVEEKEGKKLDYETFVEELEKFIGGLHYARVSLRLVDENPTVTKADLEVQRNQMEQKLKHVVVLENEGEQWKIPLMDRLDWVRFERDEDKRLQASEDPVAGFNFKIDLVDGLVEEYLRSEVAEKIELPVRKVVISKNEKGQIVFEGRPQNGKELELEKSIVAMEEAINKGEASVEVPVKEIKAPVEVADESLKDLGINNLLATGYTTYYGSPYNRQHNIAVGISRYDGALIAPGESFSFNARLGEVTAATGYRPELVIKGNETIPEYGGGLCQVSTTFYRAALYSGLPIVKRDPHSYAVGYYAQVGGHGLDATIYPDAGKDVVITNDTPGNILIQSYAEDGAAYFHFYGTDDGRSVEMEGPYSSNYHGPGPAIVEETDSLPAGSRKQVERSHNGFDTVWYRYLEKADGNVEKETILSKYRAVPAKYLVGREAATTPAP